MKLWMFCFLFIINLELSLGYNTYCIILNNASKYQRIGTFIYYLFEYASGIFLVKYEKAFS